MVSSKDVLLNELFEGIEDEDVTVPHEQNDSSREQTTGGNTFSRLRKANQPDLLDTPPVAVEVSRQDTSNYAEEGSDDEQVEEAGEEFWDEEDEIEEYMRQGGANILDDDDDGESSQDDDDLALIAGDGTTRGDMNAETQRLLREVATKDRLGKGHKVQIKAFSGLVDKLKKKKEEVFGKAAQLRAPEAPKFDDILSFAHENVGNTIHVTEKAEKEVADDTSEPSQDIGVQESKPGTIQSFFQTPKKGKCTTGDDLEESDLEVVSSDDDENDEKLIEVPKLTPTKPSPLAFDLQYGNSGELEDFEDEEKRLFDDGADSESDSESDHSWAVHEDKEGGSGQGEVCSSPFTNQHEMPHASSEPEHADEDAPAPLEALKTFSRMKDTMKVMCDQNKAPRAKKSNLIDEEAELSDEEGLGIAVSDDEDDDRADMDQNGELRDLIDTEVNDQNDDATEELHLKWSRQQDAQQLKEILRGLENGFGRRKGGPLDNDGGEMTGRQRRVRQHDNDDDGIILDMAWPSLFGAKKPIDGEDGEECEDEAMLMKAAQRKLVETQSDKLAFGSSIPLDEDSQHVLELFSNSGSELVQPARKRSRMGTRDTSAASAGSDPTTAAGTSLSFLGRQSKVPRQQSASNMGTHNKSFVFGRRDSSQSRQATEETLTNNPSSVCAAPIDFSDLRQLTSQTTENATRGKTSRLLKTLPRWNKPSSYTKKESAHVIGAVCNQVAQRKPTL